jgi:hypothetical protein
VSDRRGDVYFDEHEFGRFNDDELIPARSAACLQG